MSSLVVLVSAATRTVPGMDKALNQYFFKINLFIFGCVGSSLLHTGFL